jgi:hypothetical protein
VRLGSDIARMGHTNKLALSAFSFVGSESMMLCCAVLVGRRQGFEIHTFLVAVYAHRELK